MYALGRIESKDPRDKSFPMKAALPPVPDRRYRYWNQSSWWGDQGEKPHCVGYSWNHWLLDGPVTHKGELPVPDVIYEAAQRVDEWEGNDYDGTSVRAGAKVLQSWGKIKEYRWTLDVEDIIAALLTTGPVVVGTVWYRRMFLPDSAGMVKPEGSIVGGHAYLLNGVNRDKGLLRIKNSWGRGWGVKGNAWISFDHMQDLLSQDGEACLAIEVK